MASCHLPTVTAVRRTVESFQARYAQKGKKMPNTKRKIKRPPVFIEDEHFIVVDNDAVLTKMLQVGATLAAC
jgi:hypothetical protein